jgi:nicotinamidase/pyrazinamidase
MRLIFWDVDTQRDFMEPGGALYVAGAEALVPQLERLSRYARTHGLPIVASACEHAEADAEISSVPDYQHTFPPHCLRGTRGQQKIPATRLGRPIVLDNRRYDRRELESLLGPRPTEILITKQMFDVFSNPATATLLEVLCPESVVVYGVAQDVCVHHAIMGLASNSRRVFFVRDASRPIDAEAATRCATLWQQRGVVFTTTDAIERGVAGP